MSVLTPQEELEILKQVDQLRDIYSDMEGLCAALSTYLCQIISADAVGFFLLQDGSWEAIGELAPQFSSILPKISQSNDWSTDQIGDVYALAMNPSGTLLGVALVEKRTGLTEVEQARAIAFTLQSDSAFAQALAFRNLEDRNAELSAIYAIDHIRDKHLDFEAMLIDVIGHVLQIIPAQGAVFGLSQAGDPNEELRLVFPQQLTLDPPTAEEVRHFIHKAFAQGVLTRQPKIGPFPEGICVPLILQEQIIGGLAVLGARFTTRHERILSAIGSQVDTAIFEDLSRQRIKSIFKRYVSDSVVEEMLRDDNTDYLQGVRRDITVLFSDLRGFTALSEGLAVDVLVSMLNEHLVAMTDIVFRHGGTVDKFIGDCVMAFWGAPVPIRDHALKAVQAACEMRDAHNRLRADWASRGLPDPKIGIGMNSGEVMVGNIGGERLSSYTIIGDHVNLAARMEGLSGGDDILITQNTRDRLQVEVDLEPRGEVIVKGKTIPVATYNVFKFL